MLITQCLGVLIWLLWGEYIITLMLRFFISLIFVFISLLVVAQSRPLTHVVAKGETLYSISRLYHVTVEAIEAANKSSLGADYKIQIGQKLIIPAASDPKAENAAPAPVKTQPTPASQPAIPVASGSSTHIVQKGETVYSISKATGLTWMQIKAANHLSNDAKLQIGQRLILPSLNPSAVYASAPKEPKPEPAATPKPQPTATHTDQGKSYQASEPAVTKTEPAKQTPVPVAVPAETKPSPAPAILKAEEPKPSKPEVKPAQAKSLESPKSSTAPSHTETIIPADFSVVFSKLVSSGRKKVMYRGIGVFMPTENPGGPLVALYNYAVKGSILKVTNLMSKQFVYVRVVGKVPAADIQNDIILKVSSEAADKLKVTEDKFLVEVTGYVKE